MMVRDYLRKDTLLLYGFLIVTILMMLCSVSEAVKCGDGTAEVAGAAMCCCFFLILSFVSVRRHLKKNAEELYGEEIHGTKE
ncbi:MAG: hypothetical protein IJR83_02470 [Clostridia bacterium]|nr:hypothetical protein [Clostridia bacterium]